MARCKHGVQLSENMLCGQCQVAIQYSYRMCSSYVDHSTGKEMHRCTIIVTVSASSDASEGQQHTTKDDGHSHDQH